MNKKKFIDYVHSFYGARGLYPMRATKTQIREATNILLNRGNEVIFDSVDREKVRDILVEKFRLTFPNAA